MTADHLPDDWSVLESRSRTGTDYVMFTAPDGRRVTWYEDGRLRVFWPEQVPAMEPPHRHRDNEGHAIGASAYINFSTDPRIAEEADRG